jgi:predicted metalloprotease with PDZ domain
MYRYIFLFLVLAAGAVPAKKLHYVVDLRNTGSGRVQVTLELEMMGAEAVYYQMPAWAPGAYAVTNYGRFVENFKAYGYDGKEKPIDRINENRWRIQHAKDIQKITYEVINSYQDTTSLYFALAHFDTSIVFANGTALFGYVNDNKDLPAEITYYAPKEWQVETPLDSVSESTNDISASREIRYHASGYDMLADAPIMAGLGFQNRSFKLGKCRFDIIVASDREFEMDSLSDYTKRIVASQLDFFHDTPFDNYKFLINAPSFTKLPRKDQGALEHANSSAYLLVNVPWDYVKDPFCRIIAHEFFHAWNVKRVHSNKLGPFDYTKAVKTKELWMAEGVTDYYAHVLLSRYGILPPQSAASSINALFEAINDSGKSYDLSLEQLSLEESNFNIDNALQFYTRGTLCGLMLDIELRSKTHNKKSLDDVLLALNKEARLGRHYQDGQLAGKISAITGVNIKEFYQKYIAGTAPYPVDEYLHKLGIARHIRFTERNGVSLRTKFDSSGGILVIDTIFETSPLYHTAISRGDTLLKVGAKEVNPSFLNEWTRSHETPLTETFVFGTTKGRIEKVVTLTLPRESFTRTLDAGVLPETTTAQDTLRHSIFGTNFNFIGWKHNSTIRTFETNTTAPRN